MKMKITLLLIFTIFCSLTCLGQKKSDEAKINEQQIIIRKQIIVDDLENQLKDIQFAAVRVFVRYKLATWLWKDGKDETGRAEQLAVKSFEELYENKIEIPNLYFNSLKTDILALLENNAKKTAQKLSTKYDISSDDDLESASLLLSKKDGEKLVADKIKKAIINQSELSPIVNLLISQLQTRKSVELLGILSTIVNLEETGKGNFSADSLIFVQPSFRDSIVPNDLRTRFLKIVLNKARNAIQPSGSNIESAYYLLNSVMQDIATNAPDLLSEANILQAVLTTRISQKTNETNEINKRIEESSDKLSAYVSEAEKSEDKVVKYHLYSRAALLALEEEKYEMAVDLVEKTIEDQSSKVFPPLEFRIQYHDQFLNDVVEESLKKDNVASAEYAVKKMFNKLAMAEGLRKSAVYYFEKQDNISAIDAIDKALKLTTDAEISTTKIYTLFRLISAVQKIDKNRLSEFTTKTAKAIDAIPTLSADDKPGTENYENYVVSVMATNWNLLPVFNTLAKENKNEAMSFSDRIGKKEIKIIATFALLADSLKIEKESVKSNNRPFFINPLE